MCFVPGTLGFLEPFELETYSPGATGCTTAATTFGKPVAWIAFIGGFRWRKTCWTDGFGVSVRWYNREDGQLPAASSPNLVLSCNIAMMMWLGKQSACLFVQLTGLSHYGKEHMKFT